MDFEAAPGRTNDFRRRMIARIALLKAKAQFSRLETVRLIEIAKVGHYTSAFSAAEIFAVLYYDTMRLHRGDPTGRTATAS